MQTLFHNETTGLGLGCLDQVSTIDLFQFSLFFDVSFMNISVLLS